MSGVARTACDVAFDCKSARPAVYRCKVDGHLFRIGPPSRAVRHTTTRIQATTMDRATVVHEQFLQKVAASDFPEGPSARMDIPPETMVTLFRAQCLSRQLDRTSRAMQKAGQGYYTIGSSGHEGMAAVAEALRPTDMAFLHYRDAAFCIQRRKMVDGSSPLYDMVLSFAASSEDPVSGGRHKVLGGADIYVPPQTSTIASHRASLSRVNSATIQ